MEAVTTRRRLCMGVEKSMSRGRVRKGEEREHSAKVV